MDVFLIVVTAIALLITLFFMIFIDAKLIFWYLVDKKGIRKRLIKKYEKNNQEIYLLGSLHHMHNGLPNFGYQHLKAVLMNLNPDVLLIESRQEEIETGNVADGPLEMFYLHMAAKDKGIPVKGVDWFSYTETKPGGTNKTRDNQISKNILRYSKGYKKVLIVVGATHMLIESKRFKKLGYKSSKIEQTQLNSIFKTNETTHVFPETTIKFLDIRISRENEILKIKDLDNKWRIATTRVIEDLERFKSRL